MAQFVLTVPNEFVPTLDELVSQSGAGSRDIWLRNVIGNMLIDHQVRKEFAPATQQRVAQLTSYWT